MNTITIESLRKLCMEYDRQYGQYPENKYEGRSFFWFVCKHFGLPPPIDAAEYSDISDDYWNRAFSSPPTSP